MRVQILFILFLLLNSCKAQSDPLVLANNRIISFEGIDLQELDIQLDDLDMNPSDVTIEHILYLGIYECNLRIVSQSLEKGANPNTTIPEGDHVITELAFCKKNRFRLTKLMLNAGADINGADQENDPFLSYVVSEDDVDWARFLIGQGADLQNIGTDMNCLPLHSIRSVEMVELFLEMNVDINQNCGNGRNLLHFAVREINNKLVKYLLDNKLVDREKTDSKGQRPIDYAKNMNNPVLVQLLSN